MEAEMKNIIMVCSSTTASFCYCHFISSRIPKGKYRLLSLLPIFSLFALLPLHLTYVFPTAIIATFVTWLASFKLLLFAFDVGPLSSNPPICLPHFITVAFLPIRITQQNHNHPFQNPDKSFIPTKPRKIPLNLAAETVILSLEMGILHDYRERLHPKMVLLLYCLMMFLLVDILFAFSNVVVRALLGLELQPPSDEPYLATSLQDFWGRRWNLTVTNTLRHTVYEPVRSAAAGVLGSDRAPLAGVLSTFLVSGLMHELLLYYITRVSPTWEMTGFFVLHGLCVAVEMGVKRTFAGGGWRLHWAVSRPLTVGFLVATSFWLFFPPLTKSGADVKTIEEFKMFVEFVIRKVISIGKILWYLRN